MKSNSASTIVSLMLTKSRSKQRLLWAASACGMLLALLWALWGKGIVREDPPPALHATAPHSQAHALPAQSTADLPAILENGGLPRAVDLERPSEAERSEAGRDEGGLLAVEIQVCTRETLAPIANVELVYFDGGDDLENELELAMEVNGLDLDILRRAGRRALTDETGRARLRCRPGKLHVFALSATQFGLQRFELAEAPSEPLLVECETQRLLRVQVVDQAGRPRGGIPVRISPKQRGFLDFTYGATTRPGSGMCELGPFESDEDDVWIARIAGLFPQDSAVEVAFSAQLTDPIQLVIPAHGSLEVRLIGGSGLPYPGTATISVVAHDEAGEEQSEFQARVLPGTGRAFFPLVALSLKLDVELELQGIGPRGDFGGPGPTRAGETARIDAVLGSDYPCIVGRVVDPAGRALRFRNLEFAGAWSVDGTPHEFTAEAVTDAGGRFAICVEPGDTQRASGQLLVYCEMGDDVLGALVALELHAARADLGLLSLAPPSLLASGFVVDDAGKGVDGTSIELWKPEGRGPQRLGWAEPSLSGRQGEFELRGWSASQEIELRAKFRSGPTEGRLRVASGTSGVIVVYGKRDNRIR